MTDADTSTPISEALGLGRLFDTIRDAVVVAEVGAGRIVLWNPAAARLFGYTSEEIVGLPLETIVPERLRGKHRAGLARYKRTRTGAIIEGHRAVELPALRKDGTEFHAELMLSPMRDVSVEGLYVLGVIRDITERKELEIAKDNFIANAAHELRTPVTAVLGSADLISRWRDLPEELLEECVVTLNRQTQRLATLVRDMLDLGKLQRGTRGIQLRPVALELAVSRVLGHSVPPGDRLVSVRVDPRLHVLADPGRLDQVLTNLVVNAYAYGGTKIALEAWPADDSVLLAVADDGRGVPESLLPQLFDPFSRGENSAGTQGSGLGLTIVRMLVEAMGGRVWYERTDAGARFIFQLQAA
jgi:two-component system sensor kinase FixL